MYDDFLLDDEDDFESQSYITPEEEEEDVDEDEEDGLEEEESVGKSKKKTEADYGGKLTNDEIYLSSAYDDIVLSAKKNLTKVNVGATFDGNIIDAVRTIIGSAPKNTSVQIVEEYTKSCFDTQGHNRIPASVYTPNQPIRSADLDEKFGGTDDLGFNEEYTKEAREQIARFIEYLASRDLSKDSIISRRRKQRQIPAFIIFLFSSGMYDLIINCPTMPKEYDDQIKRALKVIQQRKYEVVEALAQRYDSRGRTAVAERVRKMGLDWFSREPAKIKTLAYYADLGITQQDVADYREFRPKFTNASSTITQELISDLIEVVIEPGKIYEKLKDRTRSDAIIDVKQVYRDWAEDNADNSELATKVIWKELKPVKNQ